MVNEAGATTESSAHIVLRLLFESIPVSSVVDVGCGVASWLCAAIELGIDDVVGLDGRYVDAQHLMIDPTRFRACDLQAGPLRHSLAVQRSFDFAMCLTVAEHLSNDRAESFIGELCDLSDLILFSAAIPGQGGTHRLNEQWPSYWNGLFVSRGFTCFDVLRFRLWQEGACEWWYLQSLLLFARRETVSFTKAARLGPPVAAPPLPLLHPRALPHMLEHASERIAAQIASHQLLARDPRTRALEDRMEVLRSTMAEKEATIGELQAEIARRDAVLAGMTLESDTLARDMEAMRVSTSWRITAPMRRAVTSMRACLALVGARSH